MYPALGAGAQATVADDGGGAGQGSGRLVARPAATHLLSAAPAPQTKMYLSAGGDDGYRDRMGHDHVRTARVTSSFLVSD